MSTDLKIIERIQKLMNVTQARGASEAEAAMAARLVQGLLAEHNLSMAAIDRTGGAVSEGGKRVKDTAGFKQVYKWQQRLMKHVAEANYCHALVRHAWVDKNGSQGAKYVFDGYDLIGRVDNVTTVKLMFEYLLEAIERLARESVGNDPTRYFTREAHSFKEGCADRLMERVRDQFEEMAKAQEQKVREQQAAARHPGAAPGTAVAILLRDVVQDERDFNEDLRLGLEPGTTRREREECKAREEQRVRERDAKMASLLAQGIGKEVAWYMANGYSREDAESFANPRLSDKPARPQTKREQEREEAANRRFWEREARRQAREERRLDRTAYRKGEAAGDTVSLNRQIDEQKRGRLA